MSTDSDDYFTSEMTQRKRRAVDHPYEREAVVLLKRAGWSVGELSMTFEASDRAIRRLIQQETGGDR